MSRARTVTEIRSIARSHTRTAVNVLVGIMRSKDATPAARVSAANAILDRGWGKTPQAFESDEATALQLIHRIERVIVHPEHASEKTVDLEVVDPGDVGNSHSREEPHAACDAP